MSMTEYNIRLIVLCAVLIIGIPAVSYFSIFKHFTKFFSVKKHKVFLVIITVLLIALSIFYAFMGISVKSEEIECVKIERIEEYGSFAGWHDTYSIAVLIDGEEVELSTPFFSSNNLRDKMEQIKDGDYVSLMIVSRIGYFYGIELAEQ